MTVWRKGMLAVYIGPAHHEAARTVWKCGPGVERPVKDKVYRVVRAAFNPLSSHGVPAIWLEGLLSDYPVAGFEGCWSSINFRPAVHDDQRCEEDFVVLLKRSKPAKITHPQSETEPNTLPASLAGQTDSHTRLPTQSRCETRDNAVCGLSHTDKFIPHGEASNG